MLDRAAREALVPAIRTAMDAIKDPCSVASGVPLGLDEMGLIDTIDVTEDGSVTVSLRLTAPFCHMIGFFKTEAIAGVSALDGVTSVVLNADNGLDWSPDRMSDAARARREEQLAKMRRSRPVPVAA